MNEMQNRYRWMTILMICSQLLLTGFVLYWLRGQYVEERRLLQAQLNHEYQKVQDQQLDSVLLEHLIIPSLDDSVVVSLEMEHLSMPGKAADPDTRAVVTQQLMNGETGEQETGDGKKSIVVDHTARWTADSSFRMEDEEQMVRSIKIFINQNDAIFSGDSGFHLLAMNSDSAAVMEQMQRVLDENTWHFELGWADGGLAGGTGGGPPGILVTGGIGSHLPPIRVERYSGSLLLTMLPQILFALTLLLLSASALLVAHNSLKKQMVLHRLRDDFIANISHELKTPVSTVKIALEALRKYDLQKDPVVSGEYLDMAASELERLEKLVGKVLQHEMLRNSSLVLQKESCNLDAMVRKVLLTMELSVREAGAHIRVISNGGECMIEADPVYMEGVIMNLIDNCLKYGGEEPEIEIRISCDGSGTKLSVGDNGGGIPAEYRDQVFEKFFRVPAGDKHNVKGYGLGLNFASLVMARHGGSISLSENSTGGSLFTLHFPDRTT